jgi:hypothetical protein
MMSRSAHFCCVGGVCLWSVRLGGAVLVSESFWSLDRSEGEITINMQKMRKGEMWQAVRYFSLAVRLYSLLMLAFFTSYFTSLFSYFVHRR